MSERLKQSTMTTPISIVIVDDHPAVLLGLDSMLSTNDKLRVTATFASGDELLRLYWEQAPAVLLLDLRMPGTGGLACIAALRMRCTDLRILVLSSYQMDEEVSQALDAGASGFISKSAAPSELCHAIERVFFGKRYLPARLAERMRERDSRDQLSAREIEIVQGLTTGDTNKEIAERMHISEYTVRNHVNHVLSKLDARDRTEAVVIAIRKGLVLLSDL